MLSAYIRYLPSQNVKYVNKHAALDLIRFAPGGISRVALAQRLALTRAAVTSIVNDLIKTDLIRETKTRAPSNGRPPIILEINEERGCVAGVDMGASHLTVIVANFGAQVLAEKEQPFKIADGPEECIRQADAALRSLLSTLGLGLSDLSAIGAGVPGPTIASEGMVLAPPIMPGWDRFPIRDTLEKLWGCPVSLNNDAELGVLGEWAYGAGRGEQNLAYIKVGTGIGAGLFIDGQIYRGATGSAGEIGHMTIDENGPLCACGNRGCLEALAGGRAIVNLARTAIQSGRRTELSANPESLTAMDVSNAAARGDLVAQEVLAEAGNQLGIALTSLVNLFNPNIVVVGGGVAQTGDLFLEPIRKAVLKRSLPAAAHAVRITTSLLGKRSTGMGAVVQALSIALHKIAS
ncbi:MAG: ROK family transcriptional regulator [Chloroflexi bacterium]|nr:ROK family transcriptional regulator [Chloroflexota bacterium]